MSDLIYCPICDERTMTDDGGYVDEEDAEVQEFLKRRYKISGGDMICMDCSMSVVPERMEDDLHKR